MNLERADMIVAMVWLLAVVDGVIWKERSRQVRYRQVFSNTILIFETESGFIEYLRAKMQKLASMIFDVIKKLFVKLVKFHIDLLPTFLSFLSNIFPKSCRVSRIDPNAFDI